MQGEQRFEYRQLLVGRVSGHASHLVVRTMEAQQSLEFADRVTVVIDAQVDMRLVPQPGEFVAGLRRRHQYGCTLLATLVAA